MTFSLLQKPLILSIYDVTVRKILKMNNKQVPLISARKITLKYYMFTFLNKIWKLY